MYPCSPLLAPPPLPPQISRFLPFPPTPAPAHRPQPSRTRALSPFRRSGRLCPDTVYLVTRCPTLARLVSFSPSPSPRSSSSSRRLTARDRSLALLPPHFSAPPRLSLSDKRYTFISAHIALSAFVPVRQKRVRLSAEIHFGPRACASSPSESQHFILLLDVARGANAPLPAWSRLLDVGSRPADSGRKP